MSAPTTPLNDQPLRDAALRASEQVVESDLPAADRLAASRTLLRQTMIEYAHPSVRPRTASSSSSSSLLSSLPSLERLSSKALSGLAGLPGISILVESVESWWAQHPMRTVAIVGGEAAKTLVRPVARRNPTLLILGAFVVGAALAASRPWRWLLRPALFIGIVPQLASRIVRRLPIDSWMTMLSSFLASQGSTTKRVSRAPVAPRTAAGRPVDRPVNDL